MVEVNKYTAMIHSKGWKVEDALKRWRIHRNTWLRMRQSEKDKVKLLDMINGLPYIGE